MTTLKSKLLEVRSNLEMQDSAEHYMKWRMRDALALLDSVINDMDAIYTNSPVCKESASECKQTEHRGEEKAVIKSTEQEEPVIAPEAAGLETGCAQPSPASALQIANECLCAIEQIVYREYTEDDAVELLAAARQRLYRIGGICRKHIPCLDTALSDSSDGGWRPIETAPRDGRGSLLFWLDDEGFAVKARWRKPPMDETAEECWWCFEMDCTLDFCGHATHWMPMPKPPLTDNGQRKG